MESKYGGRGCWWTSQSLSRQWTWRSAHAILVIVIYAVGAFMGSHKIASNCFHRSSKQSRSYRQKYGSREWRQKSEWETVCLGCLKVCPNICEPMSIYFSSQTIKGQRLSCNRMLFLSYSWSLAQRARMVRLQH